MMTCMFLKESVSRCILSLASIKYFPSTTSRVRFADYGPNCNKSSKSATRSEGGDSKSDSKSNDSNNSKEILCNYVADGTKSKDSKSKSSSKKSSKSSKKLKPLRIVHRKVSIIGAGSTGVACAAGLLNRGLVNELCLIDKIKEKAKGEALDFRQASCCFNNAKIYGGDDYTATKGSKIVIITAGAAMKLDSNESRLDLLNRNVKAMKEIVPCVMEFNENPIFIVLANPESIISYVVWKLSKLPVHQILGTGTQIDSFRFQSYLSKKFCASQSEVGGWILGEHGDSCVPIWSSVTVGGMKVRDVYPELGRKEEWHEVHRDVVCSARKLTELKGDTNWSIAAATNAIVSDILNNTGRVRAVSTEASKFINRKKEVFISLPCVIDKYGVASVLKLKLEPDEEESLCKSADIILKAMKDIKL